MVKHNIVNGPYCAELSFQLVQVWLEYLYLHVVHIVFAKLEHSVPQGISLLEYTLHVTLLGGLMLEPDLLKMLLCILALE